MITWTWWWTGARSPECSPMIPTRCTSITKTNRHSRAYLITEPVNKTGDPKIKQPKPYSPKNKHPLRFWESETKAPKSREKSEILGNTPAGPRSRGSRAGGEVFFPMRTWWAQRVQRVGRCGVGEKSNSFLTETLPKLRFLWSFHLFGHHVTWQVGPAWGVRRDRIGWEKFSIVFTSYDID
jgi:hypothetical protein